MNTVNVTLANDDGNGITSHKFNYNLNAQKTKKGLYIGALREPYEREDKKVCINLTFSDGAYSEVVLKALEEFNNHEKFTVGKEEVQRVAFDQRTELTGKHIDSKIEFKVNRGKIVIHAYNTQQKIMIQGSKHKWFVDSHLEPLIRAKISNSITKIEEINRKIITTLDQENMRQKSTSVEEPDILNCDNCDFSTEATDNFRKHIVHDHIPKVTQKENLASAVTHNPTSEEQTVDTQSKSKENFECTNCTETFDNKDHFEKHTELHQYADNLSLVFHQCRVCETHVKKQEPNIQCSKCIYFFHKKCTNKKDVKGRWRSTHWVCHICSSSLSLAIDLNPEAEPFLHQDQSTQSMRPVLPPLVGRHRKSNLNLENPEIEFLKSQIDTLKSVLSQNDEEIKKLKQSNDLKSRRITQLESKLEEAQHFVTQQARISTTTPKPHSEDSESRITLVEQKYNFVMDQINFLSTKIDQKSSNPSINFACIQCDFIAVAKNDLSNHISDIHSRTFNCSKCDFTSTKSIDIKEHKSKSHPIIMLRCEQCIFETQHNSQLVKHMKTVHIESKHPCEKCSYKAIHSSDLRRHQQTMHPVKSKPEHVCNLCSYRAIHEHDLSRHEGTMHGIKSKCAKCGYETESIYRFKQHMRNEHITNRTFFATRFSNTRNNYRQDTSSSSNTHSKNSEFHKSASDPPQDLQDRPPPATLLHCHGPCSALEKTFDHKDKLELHMQFYHRESQ